MFGLKFGQMLRRRHKKVFKFTSREQDKQKPSQALGSSGYHRRHTATNLTHTNFFHRSASQDSYRSYESFSSDGSSCSLGSAGWGGGGSNSVSFNPNQDVSCSSPADSTTSRSLENAAMLLQELREDGINVRPPQLDGDSSTSTEARIKVLVLFALEDEVIANHFQEYLRQAFPLVEVIDQYQALYGPHLFDPWQEIVDSASYVFIFMSQNLLSLARQDRMLSIACGDMELKGTNVVPIYLEDISREESDFLMDLENRWGICVERNGFRTLHRWLKTDLLRHLSNSCHR